MNQVSYVWITILDFIAKLLTFREIRDNASSFGRRALKNNASKIMKQEMVIKMIYFNYWCSFFSQRRYRINRETIKRWLNGISKQGFTPARAPSSSLNVALHNTPVICRPITGLPNPNFK